ncbi:MAG: Hsp20/alpha crystallin family protein [bacterium]
MALLQKETNMPSIFDRFFGNDLVDWSTNNFTSPNASLPAVNVRETDDDYFIEVAAPGMKKEDFKINFQNNLLTISSEKEVKDEKEEEDYARREFNYQSFQRTFTVRNTDVDSEKISATYKDGVLNIKLPKREEVKPKPAKEIKVS